MRADMPSVGPVT